MSKNQNLFNLTSKIIYKIKEVFEAYRPNLVLVQGDTTTTFATALGAFYSRIPVGHVEAGLRTGNLNAPFPEEANRCLTTRLAYLHFCPTITNAKNLKNEGIDEANIFITGNTVIDALLRVRKKVQNLPANTWNKDWGKAINAVRGDSPIILITGHRRENFGHGIKDLCQALKVLAHRYPNVQLIYPVHLNPNIKGPVMEALNGYKNIHLIPPLDYAPFVYLMNQSRIILTDSGGVQEEAPSLGKPVLVMRETTERPEAVDAGTVKLVGTDPQEIIENVEVLLNNERVYKERTKVINPYGDGMASKRIIRAILERFC